MTDLEIDSFIFYAWANNTLGYIGEKTVAFAVGSGGTIHWQFTFSHRDLNNLVVDNSVGWSLYNGSQLLTYTEGQAALLDGTYILKTYYLDVLLRTDSLPTASYGNSTITINLMMRKLSTGGYVAVNKTATITINNQTSTFINVTLTASGTFTMILKVPRNATFVQLNNVNMTDWYFDAANLGFRANITSGNLSMSFSEVLFEPWFAVSVGLVAVGTGMAYWFYRRTHKTRKKEVG
jgi:hypothetical protein